MASWPIQPFDDNRHGQAKKGAAVPWFIYLLLNRAQGKFWPASIVITNPNPNPNPNLNINNNNNNTTSKPNTNPNPKSNPNKNPVLTFQISAI